MAVAAIARQAQAFISSCGSPSHVWNTFGTQKHSVRVDLQLTVPTEKRLVVIVGLAIARVTYMFQLVYKDIGCCLAACGDAEM